MHGGREAAQDGILAGVGDRSHEPAGEVQLARTDDVDAAVAAYQAPVGKAATDLLTAESERAKPSAGDDAMAILSQPRKCSFSIAR